LTLLAIALVAAGTLRFGPGICGKVLADEPNQLPQNQPRATAAAALFRRQCAKCHGPDGRGEAVRRQFPAIPDFTRSSWQKRQADAELVQSILDGKESTMPPFGEKLSEKQARELVAYVRAFGPKRTGREQPSAQDFDARFHQMEVEMANLQRESQKAAESSPRAAPRQAARSAAGDPAKSGGGAVSRLYRQHCQKCHGADGTGSPARARLPRIPDFTDARWQRRRTDAQLVASVLDGRGSRMPAFSEKINEDRARELVAEVRTFRGRQHPGAAPRSATQDRHPSRALARAG
jgi:mono/diheme cytochrome c family protein